MRLLLAAAVIFSAGAVIGRASASREDVQDLECAERIVEVLPAKQLDGGSAYLRVPKCTRWVAK